MRWNCSATAWPWLYFLNCVKVQLMSIVNGDILAGELPASKTKLVRAWIEIHKDELLADWRLAINGAELFKIAPLK